MGLFDKKKVFEFTFTKNDVKQTTQIKAKDQKDATEKFNKKHGYCGNVECREIPTDK